MQSTDTAKNAFGRIVKWLQGHERGKAVIASLRRPASAAAISEFEAKANVSLPPALAALYRLHDGQDEDAANEKLDGDAVESGLFPSIEGRDDPPFLLVPLRQLSRSLKGGMPGFRKGWIPFGDNYGGDHIVVDLATADPKKRGRVLQFNHEYAAAVELAPSFEKYLRHIADGLASKKIVWHDDNGLSYRKAKDWDDLKQVEDDPEQEDKAPAKAKPAPGGIAGRWIVTKLEAAGMIFAISGFTGDTIDFTPGGDFVVRPPAKAELRRTSKYRYRVDKKHDPAWIDLYDPGMKRSKMRCLGIYRIEGDELLMCTGQMNAPRPDRFDRKKNKSWISYRMKRG